MNIDQVRAQFKSVENVHYLISNSLGAIPNKAKEYALKYVDGWAERGVRCWEEEWWGICAEVGDKIGQVMNAPQDSVTVQPNVTSAEAQILSCFDFSGKRNKVVMVDMEFPSLLYLYDEWLKGVGKIQIVESADGITVPLEKILNAIDETTLLVPISHVLFRSSYIVDAQAIIEKAHSVGAMVVLDIFQSIGSVPVDVTELDVDFAVGGCLKWLCGGPGACFMYVNPKIQNSLEPKFTGWMSHENPFAFDNKNFSRTKGAYRFLSGTPVIPAMYSCQAGLDIVNRVGVAAIREKSMEMTSRLIELASEKNWPVMTPQNPAERGGTVSINIENAQAIERELLARDFLVDFRPKAGIRISPHFYNSLDEIDNVINEIDAIIKDKSYKKHIK